MSNTGSDSAETKRLDIPSFNRGRPKLSSYESRREVDERNESMYEETMEEQNIIRDDNAINATPSRLAFITAPELPKFKGNRTSKDDIFSKGPEIDEFLDNFRAYLARHNIVNNNDKITSLRMNIHASQGDAKHTLSSILDDNMNVEGITFEEVEALLRRVYKKEEATSFYKSAKHYLDSINKNSAGNTVEKLRSLEVAAKEIHTAFLARKSWENNNKTTQDTLLEFMLVFAYSIYGGEKLTEKCLDKLNSNLCPREINIKFLEEKRKRNTHPETINHFVERREYKTENRPNEARYSVEKKNVTFMHKENGRNEEKYGRSNRRDNYGGQHRFLTPRTKSTAAVPRSNSYNTDRRQERRTNDEYNDQNRIHNRYRNFSSDRFIKNWCSYCRRSNHNDRNCFFQNQSCTKYR